MDIPFIFSCIKTIVQYYLYIERRFLYYMSKLVEIAESFLSAFQLNSDISCENNEILAKILSDEELSPFFENYQLIISDSFIGLDFNDLINKNIPIETIIKKVIEYYPKNMHWSLKNVYFSFKLKRTDSSFSWKDFFENLINSDIDDIVKDRDFSEITSFRSCTLVTIHDKSSKRYSMIYIADSLENTIPSDEYAYVNMMVDVDMCKDILPDISSNHLTDIVTKLNMYHENAIDIYHKFIHTYLNDTNGCISMIL